MDTSLDHKVVANFVELMGISQPYQTEYDYTPGTTEIGHCEGGSKGTSTIGD